MLASSLTHFAPVDAVPWRHEHSFAAHLALSSRTVQPVLHVVTSHPTRYAAAFSTLQATQTLPLSHTAARVRRDTQSIIKYRFWREMDCFVVYRGHYTCMDPARMLSINYRLALPALQIGSLSPSSLPVVWLLKNHFPCQREHPLGVFAFASVSTSAASGPRAALARLHSPIVANMVSTEQDLLGD